MSMTYEKFRERYQYDPKKDYLGGGGFGQVFRAYDNVLRRHVALKRAGVIYDLKKFRLKNEFEIASKLKPHANIVHYEDCYTFATGIGKEDIAIMQYHEEGDLDKLLLENRNLSFDEKCSILRQILLGLEFLHEQHPKGIIHRNLKPKNIMMARNHNKYVPKITDFGISQWIGSGKRQVSEIGGTLLSFFHDSPERIQGGKNSNIRRNTDLWSFGVIAYQALTGELPFNTGGLPIRKEVGRQEVSRQITKGNLPDGINRIEQPWQGLIRRCLEKDPEKRIQSARECLELIG